MFEKYGSKAKIRVGYGLTEACAATCLSPTGMHKKNSIGIPFPDNIYKIVKIGTIKEVKPMEDGEICICGPSVMQGYLNEKEETENTLKKHNDGKTWLHTGDIGCMDKDGFVYFKSRLKRIIISSGYNIYPSYIETVINRHEYVSSSTVIGIPDQYRGEIAKAYIVLKKEVKLTDEVEEEIKKYCEKNIAKYSMPRIFEFRRELPKTLVGKVAYTVLEKEEQLKDKVKKSNK
jgi:long-chain acyl-CoA synthetase